MRGEIVSGQDGFSSQPDPPFCSQRDWSRCNTSCEQTWLVVSCNGHLKTGSEGLATFLAAREVDDIPVGSLHGSPSVAVSSSPVQHTVSCCELAHSSPVRSRLRQHTEHACSGSATAGGQHQFHDRHQTMDEIQKCLQSRSQITRCLITVPLVLYHYLSLPASWSR